MLRIELLPDYIGDKNKRLRLYVGWGIAIAAVVIWLMALGSSAGKENAQAKEDRTNKENLEAITVAHKADIAKEQANRKQIEDRQKFVLSSQLYDDGWPEAFETIRDVKPADNSIILDSMALDTAKHQTVSLTGFGSNEKAIVRWWMSLRNNTALFDHVNFDLIPHQYAPVSQASNAGGMGGFSGMGGGGSGGMGGRGPSAAPMSSRAPGQMAGMAGSGGMGGMGGRGGGGGSTTGNGPGELEGRSGINFTASVVLRTALAGGISTPTWPAGGGGGQSGFGGMGGSGGGMGGPSSGGMGPSSGGMGPSSGGMKSGGA